MASEKSVHQHAADGEETADHRSSEDPFAPIRSDSEEIRQVAIHFINEAIVVPGLARPEPLPPWTTNKSADENHRDPQDDEAEKKRSNGKFALPPGVVARA